METEDPKSEKRNSKSEDRSSKITEGSPQAAGQSSVSDFQFQFSSAAPADRSRLKYFVIGIGAILVIVAIAGVLMRRGANNAAAPAEMTPVQKAYLSNINVADAKMSAATNFLGQRVIYLDAQVSNSGARELKQVEISMDFTDVLGQVILRERAGVFPPATLPLKAGETRGFQLFFDRIPSGWNQAPPRITVVGVQF